MKRVSSVIVLMLTGAAVVSCGERPVPSPTPGEPMDRPPLREWGPWTQTRQRWLEEGMPEEGPPQFGECDHWLDCGLDFGFVPKFEVEEIARDEQTRTYRTAEGQVVRELYERELSMPEFLEYPVKRRADFEALRQHLGLSKVHAIGWSNGAMNLILLAAESPDSLASATFLHGAASFTEEEGVT